MKKNAFFFLFLTFFIGIVACTKSTVDKQLRPTYFRLANVTFGKSFDMQVNKNNLFTNIPFDSITAYASGAPGVFNLSINDNASGQSILDSYQSMQSGIYYTLFIVPDSTSGAQQPRTSLIADNNVLPQYDSAKIRFLNFSPDTTTINFEQSYRQGNSDVFIKMPKVITWLGRTYLDNSINNQVAQYVSVHSNTYRFSFLNSNDTLKQVVQPLDVTIEKDKFYTFYLQGSLRKKGADSLKVNTIVYP